MLPPGTDRVGEEKNERLNSNPWLTIRWNGVSEEPFHRCIRDYVGQWHTSTYVQTQVYVHAFTPTLVTTYFAHTLLATCNNHFGITCLHCLCCHGNSSQPRTTEHVDACGGDSEGDSCTDAGLTSWVLTLPWQSTHAHSTLTLVSFLTVTRKFSVMKGTLLCISKSLNIILNSEIEMYIPFETDTLHWRCCKLDNRQRLAYQTTRYMEGNSAESCSCAQRQSWTTTKYGRLIQITAKLKIT